MKVLLSIKPQFADKIFDGSKKFEFRRCIFKNPDIKKIIVYSSSPVQKVIGEFEIGKIINESPLDLWNLTKEHSGISKEDFFKYFLNKKLGFAIEIKNTKKYKTPKCIKSDFKSHPPQSFLYLSN